MTQEEKELLLKDLCGRLPYSTFVQTYHYNTGSFEPLMPRLLEAFIKDEGLEIKPYLRPMSSMTEDEKNELSHYDNSVQRTDFFYSHHIDCRVMIEKGLALEAPKDMYNI